MLILELIDLKDLSDNTVPDEVRCSCCNKKLRHVVTVDLDGRNQDLGIACAYSVAVQLGIIEEENKVMSSDYKFKKIRSLLFRGMKV